jgi:hypothetical protein
MFNSLGKPTRLFGYLALALVLALSLSWFACSEKNQTPTGPQPVENIAGRINSTELATVMAVQNNYTEKLLAIKGVVGTATGLTADGRLAVKVYTEHKLVTGIPSQLDGVQWTLK